MSHLPPPPETPMEPDRFSDAASPRAEPHFGPGPEAAPADTVAGERGISSINRARSLQSRITNFFAIGLMGVLGVGLLGWYYAHTFATRSQAQEVAQSAARGKAQGEMPLPSLGPIESPALAPPISAMTSALGPAPEEPPLRSEFLTTSGGAVPPAYGTPVPATPSPEALALARKLAGPAFTRRADSTPVSGMPEGIQEAAGAMPVGAMPEGGPPGMVGGSAASGMEALLTPTATPAVQAKVLPTQRLLLAKGSFVDCTLETAIDSTLPGMTTCVTATDTFSVDGSTVLLERGTKLVGETRGQVQQGSARVFVLWSEARTPAGVIVPLASPGTDELGRSGLAGKVNRHFFERFGAAILISVIDGAIQSAVQSGNEGGTVIYNPSASQDIMTEVLRSTVNIPPTVTKAHGDRIQVLVARDLDFRSVYELRPTGAR